MIGAVVLAVTVLPAPTGASAAAPAPTPVVVGNQLIDSRSGAVFAPHGANWPGFEYACVQGWGYSGSYSPAEAAAIASWGINVIRLPLNQSCWLGLPGQSYGTAAGYRAAVTAWVDQLNAAGVAVLLDLHWSAPAGVAATGQRAMADAQSVTFWSSVAGSFATNPSVMFDLFNEPYSRWNSATGSWAFQLTWECWQSGGCSAPAVDDTQPLTGATYTVTGMSALVAAVRGAGAAQPVFLGGLNYSNDLTGWLAHRPADTQLVASWHNYIGQGCDTTTCWNSQIAPVAAVVPVVATEFGQNSSTTSAGYMEGFMGWADAHGVGYMPWAWWDVQLAEDRGNSIYALINSDFSPKAPNGTAYRAHLAALASTTPPVTPTLTAGTLVKSTAGPAIYLVDGASALIPLAAMSTATDAGVPAAFTTVSPSALSGRAISAQPLRSIVLCAGAPFVSAEGMLWPVTPSLVAGLASTPLDPATCAVLARSSTTIAGALLLTGPTGGAIYTVTATGSKRPLLTMASVAQQSAPYPARYLRVGSAFLDSLPLGPAILPAGTLVRPSDSAAVYLVDGPDRLIPIASITSATDAGISGAISVVPRGDISAIPVAPAALTNVIDCTGGPYFSGSNRIWPVASALVAGLRATTLSAAVCSALPRGDATLARALLVKSPSSPAIFALTASGQKSRVLSGASMAALTAPDPARYVTVGDSFLGAIPEGPAVLSPGMLVKSSAGAAIYLVGGVDGLLPLRSLATVAEAGLATTYYEVPASALTGVPRASTLMGNLVECGGQPAVVAAGRLWQLAGVDTGSLPRPRLTPALCGTLTAGGTVTSWTVKSSSGPAIYLVSGGARHAIGSGATYAALAAGNPAGYFTMSDAYLASIPLGSPLP